MKRKLNKIVKLFKENEVVILGLLELLLLAIMEVLGIAVALLERNYIMLSIFTYMWGWLITECFIKKYFFKRLDEILLKKPRVSNAIFFIVAFITILLSWKYFTAFILCIPQAILYGEYSRLQDEKKKG